MHRVGRTGRAGRAGQGITLVLPEQQADVSRVAAKLGHKDEFESSGHEDRAAEAALHEPPRPQLALVARAAPAELVTELVTSRGRRQRTEVQPSYLANQWCAYGSSLNGSTSS